VLTALKLNLDRLERKVNARGAGPALSELLDHILESVEMTETAIQSVQRIATDLRPAALDNLGLIEALRDEAQRFQSRSSIACQLQLPPDRLTLLPETSTAIFRVFQESLTNVARHSEATTVRASLETQNDQVLLQLEDNGKGIGVEAVSDPRSLGLLGMTERASALGGHVAIAPVLPHGTRVTLQLPLRSAAQT
jgi:signal transduction histidine kinase